MKLNTVRDIVIISIIAIVAFKFIFPDISNLWEQREPIIVTVTKTDTMYVDVYKEIPVYVPRYIERVVRDTVEVPAIVDTTAVIEDYYATYVYKDTLKVDTLGYGYLTDTISKNRIESRSVIWDYRIPTITTTTSHIVQLPPVKRNDIFVGVTVGGSNSSFNYVGSNIGLKTKSNKLITVGAGIVNWNSIGYNVSFSYRIGSLPRFLDFLSN